MAARAFAVLEDCENSGGIVFAEHAIVARRLGANEYNGGDFGGISCRRAPWADAFAGSDVPAKVMIAHGWHFECFGCGARIDEDWLADNDLPLDGVIGTQHQRIYCNRICQCRDDLNRAIKEDHERRAIDALETYVRRRFPSVEFEETKQWRPHAYAVCEDGVWHVKQVVVSFKFPGMKVGAASCRFGRDYCDRNLIGPIKPQYSCCFGDKEAFEMWAASPESRT